MGYLEHPETLPERDTQREQHASSKPLRRRSFRWLRAVLAASAALAVAWIAFAHDSPGMMLVGLAPLALIAAEAAWHLFDDGIS
jgi:hypothetical protein